MKMWNDLSSLENLRFWVDVTAAVLGILAAALIVTSRWPLAQRISALQKQEKVTLQARLGTAEESTLRLSAELSEARQKQLEAEAKIQEVGERAMSAEREAGIARANQLHRTLSNDQVSTMLSMLKGSPRGKVDVSAPAGDSEAFSFAVQIHETLKRAGFDSEEATQDFFSGPNFGISLLIQDPHSVPAHFDALVAAFKEAGLQPDVGYNPSRPEGSVSVIVGTRPGS